MALVAYSDESDISDTEGDSNSEKSSKIQLITNESQCEKKNSLKDIINDEPSDVLSSLPVSTKKLKTNLEIPDASDVVDDVPTVKTWNIPKIASTSNKTSLSKPKKNKLKFILPSLTEFDDDEEIEEEDTDSARKKLKPSSTGTGLFAVLPKPRGVTSLIPYSLTRKPPVAIQKEKKKAPTVKPVSNQSRNDSDEEDEAFVSTDFFSLESSDEPLPVLTSVQSRIPAVIPTTVQPQVTTIVPNTVVSNEVESSFQYGPTNESFTYEESENAGGFDSEAMRRLTGRRNASEISNIIDVNADDALMNREEWVNRALSEEKPQMSFSNKKEGNPTHVQKRKHQITYLAHQAKEREQELQATWSQNKHTKRLAQSRYGFR